MNKVELVRSRLIPLNADDVDTDQIIPARFLKVTERAGLGTHLFADWRYLPDDSPRPEFVLNRAENQGAQILLAGNNFGCGSSREHAPWALYEWGIRAVIARSFADIFRANALKNGLVPVAVDAHLHRWLSEARALDAALTVIIDVQRTALILPDGEAVPFPLDPFARRCLLDGVDELEYLRARDAEITAYEARNG